MSTYHLSKRSLKVLLRGVAIAGAVAGFYPGVASAGLWTGDYPVWTLRGTTGSSNVSNNMGSPLGFVNGVWWDPSGNSTTGTNQGTVSYWGAIDLPRAASISSVNLETYCVTNSGSPTPSAFKYLEIQTYDDSTSTWNTQWTYDDALITSTYNFGNVVFPGGAVTTQHLRVYWAGTDEKPGNGDYTAYNSQYGGPGLNQLQPLGTNSVSLSEANLALSALGGSVTWSAALDEGNVANMIDGYVRRDTGRTGLYTAKGVPGSYFTIDLGQVRAVDTVKVLADWSVAADVYLSTTGLDGSWNPVAALPQSDFAEVSFTPLNARYVRLVNTTSGNNYWLVTEAFVYGGDAIIPEPASLTLLLFGSLALLRRRRA